ncbi:MAG TPA: hypothetical protein VF116_03560 [Ktedonobacterales bacterium]
MIPLLLAVLLGLAALLVVIQPLLVAGRDGAPEATTTPLAESAEREQTAKQALLDVELDHRLGNLEAEDYATLRARYEERALAALKARYDAERALDAAIDQQLARLRARREGRNRRDDGKLSSAAPTRAPTKRAAGTASAARPNSVRARRRRGT